MAGPLMGHYIALVESSRPVHGWAGLMMSGGAVYRPGLWHTVVEAGSRCCCRCCARRRRKTNRSKQRARARNRGGSVADL